jgi:hypothetical protein
MPTDALPGAEIVEPGLADLAHGAETIESLVVSIAAPALRDLGLHVPTPLVDPEMRLYRLLAAQLGDGAHSRYNSLIRRVVSYQRAARCVR